MSRAWRRSQSLRAERLESRLAFCAGHVFGGLIEPDPSPAGDGMQSLSASGQTWDVANSFDVLLAASTGRLSTLDGTTTAIPLLKAGRVKALGAATPTRVPVLPDVPTIAEQGIAGIDIVGWQGLFAPGGMSAELTERVSNALRQVVTSAEMTRLIQQQGAEPSGVSASEFAAIVRRDHDRWGEVIRNANIKLE